MEKKEASKAYPDYKKVIQGYKEADKYAWVNDGDQDLQPIRIPLPETPDWELIHGFGKKADDQVFEYEEYPNNLKLLEDEVSLEVQNDKTLKSDAARKRAVHKRIVDELRFNPSKYEEDIEWIKSQWAFRIYGKWFFINGKPTWLPGQMWLYLNYYNLEQEGLPTYKDRDRRWYLAQWYFSTTTEVPVLDSNHNPIKNTDGSLRTKDIGYRVWLGTNNLKGRRVGETSKTLCWNMDIVTSGIEARTGIQANVGKTGEGIFFEKFLPAFNKMPFFFIPIIKSQTNSSVHFQSFDGKSGLGAFIDYADNAKKSYYDSKKLTFYHGDEVAKVENVSIKDRHDVVKKCLTVSSRVDGYCIYTSTVEDLDMSASKEFAELTKHSHYNLVSEYGATSTGMVNIFFRASDGDPEFLGKYGESIEDDPSPNQIPYMKRVVYDENGLPMGAYRYKESVRKHLSRTGDLSGLVAEKRQEPLCFRDCFTPPATSIFFNIKKLEERYNDLEFNEHKDVRRGRLVWGVRDSIVEFVDDDNGNFLISKMPDKAKANKKITRDGMYYPQFPNEFVASADSYKSEKTDGYRMSFGAGAVRWMRDSEVDPDEKDVKEWVSGRLVCTYKDRPPLQKDYLDDMIKMCVFFGAMMYPEMDVQNVYEHFIERGFGGYLLYDTDPSTGLKKNLPGFHSRLQSKQTMFNLVRDDIELHAHRCKHIDWLEECLKIRGLDDMTNYDIFTAVGGTLLAEKSSYGDYLKQLGNMSVDVSGFAKW